MKRYEKHGGWGTPIYDVWRQMVHRCTHPGHRQWADYGGRGITVCQRWRDSFAAFRADMGPRPPGASIDRRDNDRGYTPDNCHWASPLAQSMNQRRPRLRDSNKSGVPGVRWRDDLGRFEVRISLRRSRIALGCTPDFFEACCLRKSAESRLLSDLS